MSRDRFHTVANVPVAELLLDAHNPRIRQGADQNDCIARILRERSSFQNLLKDIAANGLSPEHILVSKNTDGKWTVRDGNRRVTALKLLNRPELCGDDRLFEQIVRRARDHAPNGIPAAVDCIACDDEQTITAYLERKHTGENEGVGQRGWSALVQSLFNLNAGHRDNDRRAAQLILWAEARGLAVADDYPITTLTRGLNVRHLDLIGFRIENDELIPSLPEHQAYALAARVINAIGTGEVNMKRTGEEGSIFTPEAQLAFFKGVRNEIGPALADSTNGEPPNGTAAEGSSASHDREGLRTGDQSTETSGDGRLPQAEPPTAAGAGDGPKEADTPASYAPRMLSWQRKYLFGTRRMASPGFSVPGSEKKAQQIVIELRRLDVTDTLLAATMLLRALLESSDTYYRSRHGLKDKNALHANIAASADHMKTANLLTDNQHAVIMHHTRTEASLLHVRTIQAIIHKDTFFPTQQNLNTTWDEICHFVRACWR